MSEHTLTVLLPEEVQALWPEIRLLLAPAIAHCNGEFELDDLLGFVQQERAFVVALRRDGRVELAAVCECLDYPRKTVLNVLVLGGRSLNLVAQEFWPRVVDVARVLGATAVRGAVRPSMERYYRRIAPDAARAYAVLERRV